MIRRLLPRIPLFRVSAPILPMTTRLAVRSMPSTPSISPSRLPSRLFHHFPARRSSSSSSPPPSPSNDTRTDLPPDATLSQRLKHLIKAYGWYALGVYLILSTLDFGVAFVGINLLGAEHVARLTTTVKELVAGLLHSKPPEPGRDEIESPSGGGNGHEGLYAMLVLAYTVHKTLFLPVRVGLTAAFTPRLVGWLRRRGWAGGEGTKRAAREMRDRMRKPRE